MVATGEQVSIGLVAIAIQAQKGKAISFLGSQCRIVTDSDLLQGAHQEHRRRRPSSRR